MAKRWSPPACARAQTPRSWLAPPRPVDAMDAKGDLWTLLAAVGVPLEALMVTTDAPAFLHPGRSGIVRQGPKTVLGYFGELHPRVLAALDLPGPMVAFELNLDAVAEPKRAQEGRARSAGVPAGAARLRVPGRQHGHRRQRAARCAGPSAR